MQYNPFDKWKAGFKTLPASAKPSVNPGGNLTPANFAVAAPNTANTSEDSLRYSKGTPVEFPRHLFIPEGAQGIDITRVCLVLPGTNLETLMSFTAPDGGMTNFVSYGVFTDAEFEADILFRPELEGSRIFQFHGDPQNGFKIAIGTGPDLSNNSLKSGHIVVQPNQTISWKVSNSGTIAQVMGVRMVGYFISSQTREATRVGA